VDVVQHLNNASTGSEGAIVRTVVVTIDDHETPRSCAALRSVYSMFILVLSFLKSLIERTI
jgi:hypothetical protein